MASTDDRDRDRDQDDPGFGGSDADGPPSDLGAAGHGTPAGSGSGDDWARRLDALHAACLAGDPVAWGKAFDLLFGRTVRRVSARGRFRRVDPQMVADAVTDALVEYVTKPRQYDASAGVPLDRRLERAAARNVLNLLRSETRRRRRERKAAEASAASQSAESVELPSAAGNVLSDEATAEATKDRERLLALLHDPADRRVLELQLAGERKTAAFATVLGVGHLPPAEQRKLVKRAKDRIDKILRRAVRRDGKDDIDKWRRLPVDSRAVPPAPSPGTPGEGWGGGPLANQPGSVRQRPACPPIPLSGFVPH